MASGTRQSNTMEEGLRKLLGQITDLKLTDNANLPYLIQLETQVLGYLKGGADSALSGQPQPGMGGAPGSMGGAPMGGAPAGLMGSPSPLGGGTPQGVPGLMQGPSAPNTDELRRMLAK